MDTVRSNRTNSMARQRHGFSLWAMGAILALLCAVSTQADASPLLIDSEVIIHWASPLLLAGGSFTGASSFEAGHFELVIDGPAFDATSTFGTMTYLATPEDPASGIDRFIPPGPPAIPGSDFIWQFGGISHTGLGDFATCAFTSDPLHPPSPCNPDAPALITLGLGLMPGFTPIDLTGPIYAFDDTVQVGAWEVRISPSAVPEPGAGSLALIGIGLTALAIRKRFKPVK